MAGEKKYQLLVAMFHIREMFAFNFVQQHWHWQVHICPFLNAMDKYKCQCRTGRQRCVKSYRRKKKEMFIAVGRLKIIVPFVRRIFYCLVFAFAFFSFCLYATEPRPSVSMCENATHNSFSFHFVCAVLLIGV